MVSQSDPHNEQSGKKPFRFALAHPGSSTPPAPPAPLAPPVPEPDPVEGASAGPSSTELASCAKPPEPPEFPLSLEQPRANKAYIKSAASRHDEPVDPRRFRRRKSRPAQLRLIVLPLVPIED